MKRFMILACAGMFLAGCASMSTDQVATNVNNAVTDTATVANGTVSIITDIARALISVSQPVTAIITAVSSL